MKFLEDAGSDSSQNVGIKFLRIEGVFSDAGRSGRRHLHGYESSNSWNNLGDTRVDDRWSSDEKKENPSRENIDVRRRDI